MSVLVAVVSVAASEDVAELEQFVAAGWVYVTLLLLALLEEQQSSPPQPDRNASPPVIASKAGNVVRRVNKDLNIFNLLL